MGWPSRSNSRLSDPSGMIGEFAEGFAPNKRKNKPARKAATKSILHACHSALFLVDYSLSREKRNPLAPQKKCSQAARESI
jgi:hypothetical protein